MKIDKEFYRYFEIETWYNEKTKYFYATSKVANSHNEFQRELNNYCHGFKTPKEAVDDVKKRIDEFLDTAPKNYEELAKAITNSLVWPTETDCYVDSDVLERLVEAFINNKK